jgi:hypothetical protein
MDKLKNYLSRRNIDIKRIARSDKKSTRNTEDAIVEIVGTYDSRHLKKSTILGDLISMDNISSVTDEEE